MIRRPPRSTLFPYTTLFRSSLSKSFAATGIGLAAAEGLLAVDDPVLRFFPDDAPANPGEHLRRSEEHTSELQSRQYLVCRLLLEKKTYYSIFHIQHHLTLSR